MPIKKVSGGYQWGNHGKVYPNRVDAEKQAAAAHAAGYAEDESFRGAGIVLIAPDNTALFTLRSAECDNPFTWCFPGGQQDGNELPEQTAIRETIEEAGYSASNIKPFSTYTAKDSQKFYLFKAPVKHKFTPKLSDESTKFVWASLDNPPEPLHYGVKAVLNRKNKLAQDADKWITVHPNGKDNTGRPALIGEGGVVKAGMGGKFNGKSISQAHKGAESASVQVAKVTLSPEQREKYIKSRSAYSVGGQGIMPMSEFKQKLRNGELDHLADKFDTAEKELQQKIESERLEKESAKKQKTSAMSEKYKQAAIEKNKAFQARKDEANRIEEQKRQESKNKAIETHSSAKMMPGHERTSEPLEIKKETDSAYLLKTKSGDKWVPKSQVTLNHGHVAGISDWLAKREGFKMAPSSISSPKSSAARELQSPTQKRSPPTSGKIDESDPSVWGHELLGHEGETWESFYKSREGGRFKDKYK